MTARRLIALALLCAPLAVAAAPPAAPVAPGAAPGAPSSAPIAPAGKSSCTAVTRGKFHLRPKAQVKSAGPQFPKGTALIVLAQQPPPEAKDHRPIYQVQVQKSGATGYVYLRRSELGAACPLIWPGSESLKAGQLVKEEEGTCLLPGPAKSAKDLYSKKCDEPRGPDKKKDKYVDLNGDGRPDWLVVGDSDSQDHELAVLLNTPAGFRTVRLETSNAKDWQLGDPLAVGSAVYIMLSTSDWENFHDESGEVEQEGSTSVTLFRIFPDGSAYRVFAHSTQDHNESCGFTGHADQSLTMTCDGGKQRLRWDAAAKVLRPTLDPPG